VTSSGGAAVNGPGAGARVETVFAPDLAAFGFLLGAPVGGVVGSLWGRRGLGGAVGFALVTLLCGFAGLVAAGLLGAETRVTVSGNSRSVEHGPPTAVLLLGGALGTLLGALCAWRFGPSKRFEDSPPRLSA